MSVFAHVNVSNSSGKLPPNSPTYIHVDLDYTMANGIEVFLLGGPGATVEDEKDRLGQLRADGLLHKSLMLSKQLRVQLDIAGLDRELSQPLRSMAA